MARYIVLVIDSYGIGMINDGTARPEDFGANTFLHVFEANPSLKLPALEKLGLGNIADTEEKYLKHQKETIYGSSLLQHWGADTFLGHQELLGTTPIPPIIQAFSYHLDRIEKTLLDKGYKVRRYGENLSILIVNESAVIGDNLETDLGQNYNVTVAFDLMSYEEAVQLGRFIRSHVSCNRVITFGAPKVSLNQLLSAYQEIENTYAGVSAPRSGVYKEGYKVLHLGYGINHQEQVPYLLGEAKIPSILIGKVADVVENHSLGKSYGELVDSTVILDLALEEIKKNTEAFFCINIQETDLAGHSQDALRYASILQIVDQKISEIISLLAEDDLFLITADHGNDPLIGHSKHTREIVPILIYAPKYKNIKIGQRNSLSDIGASACDFFKINNFPPNGSSFLG